jgi:TonB-linked SusC/RagA family outer membrane protein
MKTKMRKLLFSGLLVSLFGTLAAQDVTIRGTVTDLNGVLPGATIAVKGTTSNATTSGIDGNYTITVPNSSAVLVFSFLGYATQEIPVGNRSTIDAVLEETAKTIDEIVVIGYGNQRKEDLSMSVSTMKIDDVIKGRPSDIGTALQGRISGVTVLKSGDPMKATSFYIRGRGSKGNDNDPASANGVLFVVDGVPNAPYSIDDVESITILKDAASSSIYGAQVGASGVVLVTTKGAKAGKIKMDFNASIGYQNIANLPDLLTAEKYNTVWAKAVTNSANGQLPSAADPTLYPWGNTTRTDWLDEIFRIGKVQHYGVTLSGGSETIQTLFSLAYDKTDGTLLNTWTEGVTARLNTNFKINKWLSFHEKISVSYSDGQGNVDTSHEGPIMSAVWYPRSASVYEMNQDGIYVLNEKGEKIFGGTSPTWASVSGYPLLYNPVAALTRMHRRYPDLKLFSTSGIELTPLSNLTIKSDFTINLGIKDADEFYPKMEETGLIHSQNNREEFHEKNYSWLWESTATYSQVFADKHHVSAMAGFTMDYKKIARRGVFTQEYPFEEGDSFTYDGAKWGTTRSPEETIRSRAMVGVLGRIGYSFDDRYFLVASIRVDGASVLPQTHRFDNFPALSASWKLSSEPLFKKLNMEKYINLIKFRAGWGKTGNVDLYPFNTTDVSMLSTYYSATFGKNLDKFINGTYLNTIPNYDATWETTEQTSVGLDVLLLNRTLEFNVDYYNKQTKNLIDYIPTPQQVGVADPPMGNMGEVINKGWELSANYRNTIGKFGFNVWGMVSFNDGYVKNYGNRLEPVTHQNPNLNSTPLLYSYAGYPWHSFMIYQTAGIFQSYDEVVKYVSKNPETGQTSIIMPNAKPGDVRYVDANGDGVINGDDRVFMGSYDPKRTFSFGASVDFKGFDFSIMFQGVAGNYVYNGMKQMAMNGRQSGGNLIREALDTWDFNPNSQWPRLGLVEDPNGNYLNFSDLFLEQGDYLRLKNITLGYTLPASLLRHISMEKMRLRLYISADNVLTITGYTGMDPETGNYGIDRGIYPVARFVNFGINLNF